MVEGYQLDGLAMLPFFSSVSFESKKTILDQAPGRTSWGMINDYLLRDLKQRMDSHLK